MALPSHGWRALGERIKVVGEKREFGDNLHAVSVSFEWDVGMKRGTSNLFELNITTTCSAIFCVNEHNSVFGVILAEMVISYFN